jgi:hypothetical protein
MNSIKFKTFQFFITVFEMLKGVKVGFIHKSIKKILILKLN